VPVIGPQTIEICAVAGVSWITIEAGRTLLLEKGALEELGERHRIGIHAL